MGEARDVFENLDLYSGYDAVAVNIYPSNLTAGMDPGERQYLTLLHERTGKPLLVTEWSVPARKCPSALRPRRWSPPWAGSGWW